MTSIVSGEGKPYDVLILSNGPGELTTWVRPVVLEMRQHLPQARLSLMLTPCPHASGQEIEIAQEFIGVDRVQDPDYFLTFLLTGQTEEAWDWAPRGVVVFLGGDQFFAVRAGWILGYRVVVYAEHEPRWRIWVDAFGVRNERIRHRYGGGPLLKHRWQRKMHVIGDLMVDGVASATYLQGLAIPGWSAMAPPPVLLPQVPPKPAPEPITELSLPGDAEETTAPDPRPPVPEHPDAGLLPRGWSRLTARDRSHYQICILPGSKPAKLSLGLPMGLAIADELRQILPNVRFVIPVAPTIRAKDLIRYIRPKTNPDMGLIYGTSAILEQTNLGAQLVTPFGTTVRLWTTYPAYSVMANADLCITTIGANTAELARLGVPMIVLIPLNKLDAMRAWDGILGLLVNLPWVGTILAKAVNWIANRYLKWLAWPNIWANQEVVPELRGHLYPVDVARQAAQLLGDPSHRQEMRDKLRSLGGDPGAAKALVHLVIAQLGKAKRQSRGGPIS